MNRAVRPKLNNPAALTSSPETVFYDGDCGLCHRWVEFIVPRDPDGLRFIFAPLAGETFIQTVSEQARAELPDSIVVLTADGRLLVKSTATLHIMRRLGGIWAALSAVGRVVPRSVRDFGYDRLATVRHRVFKKPSDACPIVPPELRQRFKP